MRGVTCPLAVALALGLSACAHPQARAPLETVPLNVPPVPARIIAPPPPAEPPPAAQEPDPATQKPARPRPPQTKTEPPAPTPAVPPAVAQPPTVPAVAGALQTASPASQAEMVKTIRDLLTRAERDLKNVDYSRLSADGKAQYSTATRFASQAEQALKDKNFVFALTLADKAATLARSLAGRGSRAPASAARQTYPCNTNTRRKLRDFPGLPKLLRLP